MSTTNKQYHIECADCLGRGYGFGELCDGGQGKRNEPDCEHCDGSGWCRDRGCEACVDAAHADHKYDPDCKRCQEDGPPDSDGEDFRGGEAAAFERESMTTAQRFK